MWQVGKQWATARKGDVILGADRRKANWAADVQAEATKRDGNGTLLLLLKRGDASLGAALETRNRRRPVARDAGRDVQPGLGAARPLKREIGRAENKKQLRGANRGSGVAFLVTQRDSASLRRSADG